MMKALVTGGAGFIGYHLVNQLVEKGYQTTVLDIKEPKKLNSEVKLIKGSINDPIMVKESLKAVDVVFHLAANPNLWAKSMQDFLKINYDGTKQIVGLAKNVKRFIHVSSEAVLRSYKRTAHKQIDENDPLPQLDDMPGPYTRSKLMADFFMIDQIKKGFPGIIVYPTTPVGTDDYNLTPPTKMIKDFLTGDNPAYYNCMLNLISVKDIARGMIASAESGDIGERYILGNKNLSLKEILQILEYITGIAMPKKEIPYFIALITAKVAEIYSNRVTHRPPIASVEGVRLAGSNLVFNVEKFKKQLGIEAQPVESALQETAAWLTTEYKIK